MPGWASEQEDEEGISTFFHHGLHNKVKHIEWIFLSLALAGSFLSWRFSTDNLGLSTPLMPGSLVALAIVGLMNLADISDQSWLMRFSFLMLELALLCFSTIVGVTQFNSPLFVLVAAKATILLRGRGTIAVGIAAFLLQWAAATLKIGLFNTSLQTGQNMLGWMLLAGFVVTFTSGVLIAFVVILTSSLIGEQKSRLESERLGKEVEHLARELERVRIAREIHDSVGHLLTSLKIQLEVARKFMKIDPAKSEAALLATQEIAQRSLLEVRSAIYAIRHPDFDLQQELQELAQKARSDSLVVVMKIDLPDNIADNTAYQLYRIVQECLTNVLKHAQASNVEVDIGADDKHILVTVCDDGKGHALSGDTEGLGLVGIRERVQSLSGTLSIDTGPDQGTKIKLVVPH